MRFSNAYTQSTIRTPSRTVEGVVELMLDATRNFDRYWQGPMTTFKYAKLVKCSTDTALRDIQELQDRSILIQNPAGGRSTSYRPAKPDEL